MKRMLVMIASSVILIGVVTSPGQTKPVEEMSISEQTAFLKEQKLKVLKKLPGVFVFAWWKSPHPSEENERLQTAVELRLRNNGVHVFATSNEYKSSPGRPMLLCMVQYLTTGPVLSARTDVQLVEEVRSIRTSRVFVMPTWENTIPRRKVVEHASFEQAREWLFEAVDEFCNAYRAVNPKSSP